MEGLITIGEIPPRHTREEYKILIDEPVYNEVKRFASHADMQEIDGWARSFYTLEGHLNAIALFRKPLISEPTDPLWNATKAETYEKISTLFPKVAVLPFETGFDSVPYESSSAAGYGYEGKKGEGNNFSRAKKIANAAVRTFKEEIDAINYSTAVNNISYNSTPDVAFTRTQLAKLPSIKVRIVFGEAFHNILIEGLSAAPLLAAFKSMDTFYFMGKDPTTHVPRLLYNMSEEEGWFICLDWKSFDATVQLWEIDHAFNCIETLLSFDSDLSKLTFIYARESFKKRKLASPDGKLYMRTGGIPSGSYFTNIIGSIINYVRIHYICHKLELDISNCFVQGDDSVIFVRSAEKPNIYEIADAGSQFGWILNPSKCTITAESENVTFLGRSQMHQFNIRERLKVLRLMCFPEYEVGDSRISTARVKAIARDAGFNDPLYNKIYYALKTMYGEADSVPHHLLTYISRFDFQDVNM